MLIVAKEAVLTQILKPIPPPLIFFGNIPKHLDVHFNSSPEFKAYIHIQAEQVNNYEFLNV